MLVALGAQCFMTLDGLRTSADCEERKSETQFRDPMRTRGERLPRRGETSRE